MTENLSLSGLKRYLSGRSREELAGDIADLFRRLAPVRDYYQSKIFPLNDSDLRMKYKKLIEHEFFPDHGFGKSRLSVARKAVSDYRKISDSYEGAADLMLYYVERGVEFTNQYGD